MSDKLKEMTEKNKLLERSLQEADRNNRKLKVRIILWKTYNHTISVYKWDSLYIIILSFRIMFSHWDTFCLAQRSECAR